MQKDMKILQICNSDLKGGAAIAANRLHKALGNSGVSSFMLVLLKRSDDNSIYQINKTRFNYYVNKVISKIDSLPLKFYKNRIKTGWSVGKISNFLLLNSIKKINPDILHIHWINGGLMSINDILGLSKKKVIFWTLHDMWSFTGGCHYVGNCEKYKIHCHKCPQLRSNKNNDLSFKLFKKKLKTFSKIDLKIIVLNNWMKKCVQESKIFGDKDIFVVPNSLDINIFKPQDKLEIRKKFNLPINQKLILFGAMNSTSDKRKGFIYLKKAIEKIGKNSDFALVIFGADDSKDIEKLSIKSYFVGIIKDERKLAELYSTCDVFVGPSLEDNLPNTFLESLSCGTPVVGFNTGGIPDIIDHKKNGYLAKFLDVEDLKKGILFCLDKKNNKKLSTYARKKGVERYSYNVQAKKMIKLYQKVIHTK